MKCTTLTFLDESLNFSGVTCRFYPTVGVRHQCEAVPNNFSKWSNRTTCWIFIVSEIAVALAALCCHWKTSFWLICEKNNNFIIKQINLKKEQKSAALKQEESHLLCATMERSSYQSKSSLSKQVSTRFQHRFNLPIQTAKTSLFNITLTLPNKFTTWQILLSSSNVVSLE